MVADNQFARNRPGRNGGAAASCREWSKTARIENADTAVARRLCPGDRTPNRYDCDSRVERFDIGLLWKSAVAHGHSTTRGLLCH
jgi:hypothetical protein